MNITSSVIHAGPIAIRFLVEAEESGGSVSVFECRVPPDVRTPAPHSHDGFEETIYGLSGVSTWTVDGEAHDVGPGEALCIRRGAVHAFANTGDVDAVFLAVATPGLFGPAYFLEVGEVVAAAAGGPPDLEAIAAVMRRHGLTPAPPPAG
jgi:quercetin dioxygenase-like cupin family protein